MWAKVAAMTGAAHAQDLKEKEEMALWGSCITVLTTATGAIAPLPFTSSQPPVAIGAGLGVLAGAIATIFLVKSGTK